MGPPSANNVMQSAVAEEFGEKLRGYQEVMFPAAYGDGTREWTHLVLTKVGLTLHYPWALQMLTIGQHTHEQVGVLVSGWFFKKFEDQQVWPHADLATGPASR